MFCLYYGLLTLSLRNLWVFLKLNNTIMPNLSDRDLLRIALLSTELAHMDQCKYLIHLYCNINAFLIGHRFVVVCRNMCLMRK